MSIAMIMNLLSFICVMNYMNKFFDIGQFLYFCELLYNGGDEQTTFLIKNNKLVVTFFYFRRAPG